MKISKDMDDTINILAMYQLRRTNYLSLLTVEYWNLSTLIP